MYFRPVRPLTAAAVTLLLLFGLASIARAAGEKDKDATKLLEQAMNEDYLNTNFAKAEKKLLDALKRCGGDGCSAGVVGKIHVALGTIYGIGLNKPDQAKEQFTAALKADPKAALDESLSNADLTKIWNDAKKGASAGKAGEEAAPERAVRKPSTGSDTATHTPPAEQTVNTPVPLYVEAAQDMPLSKVTLRYKPFGAKQYKTIEMKRHAKGFGAEIPCEDVSTTGEVHYFFALFDENGEAAGTLGSAKDSFKITIKREIEGEPPALPGQKPPEQCREKADCPPGLPGCPAAPAGKRGDKGWGATCEATQECQTGLICLNGSCEEGVETNAGGDASKSKVKRNLIGVSAALDIMYLFSKENVCSTPDTNASTSYACFLRSKSAQFGGGLSAPNTNGIAGGLNFAGLRVLASYDRQLVRGFPLSAGIRAGWAFGGSPTPDNEDEIVKARKVLVAKPYLGLHLEARLAYHPLGDSLLERLSFRPYVFLGLGVAQVNGAVNVNVCAETTNPDAKLNCNGKNTKNETQQGVLTPVDAYQVTGLNFFGVGGGTTFGITPNFGLNAELKVMVMFTTVGLVFAPSLGPVVAF